MLATEAAGLVQHGGIVEKALKCYLHIAATWWNKREFALRLFEGKTVDEAEMAILEVIAWRDVLTRLISII